MSLLFVFFTFYAALCGSLAWETVRPKPRRMTITPRQRGIAFEDVTFTSADETPLRGWYIPSQNRSKGIVICCHGVDSTREDLLYTAETLHTRSASQRFSTPILP